MPTTKRRLILFILSLFLIIGTADGQSELGEVSFANSGAAAAQPAFLRGLALLHDFEYSTAAEAFREAQKIDPAFAMAYWGEAMTYTHPVWFQQDADAARAVLQRLGATSAERLAKAPTERERDYLRTLDVLYGEGTKEQRDFRFSDAMAALHAKYPDDVDATAFTALSLLGTAHEGRDFATYMRAAALLEEVFPTHLHHPGVLHYLIHSYDDPIHAPLGLRAARLYGAVAPNAGHALHMTSHIFIALGMWNDVVAANRRAIDVVNRQNAARGRPSMACGHYPLWLHYALVQQRDYDGARKVLDACRMSAFEAKFVPAGAMDSAGVRINSFSEMLAHLVASGGVMTAADQVAISDAPENAGARMNLAYADALAAAKRGDAAALEAAAGRVHANETQLLASIAKKNAMNPSGRITADIVGKQVDALVLLGKGKRDEAIALLETTAAAETSMPFEFGPPTVPKPTLELLADTLLASGRAADAAAAYRKSLERTPGRAASVEGLKRSSNQ